MIWTCAMLLMPSVAHAQGATVSWSDDRLTVQAENIPLQELLEEVARRTGVLLSGADRLSGLHSAEFRDTPLTEAVRILLENVNYLVTNENGQFHIRIHSMTGAKRVAKTGPVSIPGLTDRVAGESDAPDPTEAADDEDEEQRDELKALDRLAGIDSETALAEIATAVESDYAPVRIRALRMLAARRAVSAIEEMAAALADPEVDVALTASDALAAIPGDAALEALTDQLLDDGDEEAQFAALRALALRADLASIPHVRRAVQEAPLHLRGFAAALLKELEGRAKAGPSPKG